ncbi:flagellar motor stator protein MotA [Undibacterium cyanobacteriorum]|uniref:Flagellar motor stator protein MotA n=1 Tax=Undibacterium cyanobacteriorum TaxID=3073561 RepID=A0ABY9RKH4_9BURK|nr:flagellar motor stator protein MotA [Undibacterium sp. 20NA77.5]WMW81343.1 flagellar motor stator protein MotA [Undibacterium sp. 20NA77.5]
MLIIIGFIVVLISVFGGFAIGGGHLAALFQPNELLMIAGAAIGAFIIGNDKESMLTTLRAIPTIFKPNSRSKFLYLSLLTLLFELLTKVRKEGLMAIESDIDNIYESAVFAKYPVVLQDAHLMEFLCDYLRLMVSGNVDSHQLENLMDVELDTHHTDEDLPIQVVSKMADSLPAFGIVAAVMGVVHTMESVGMPPGELGILIAKALVGTFLGILLSYGFVAPIAARLEQKLSINTMAYHCVKVTIIASLNGYSPPIAVEFGRKALSSRARPSFRELEEEIRHAKGR